MSERASIAVRNGWRRWSGFVVLALLAAAGAASLVTLAETNAWWVRYLDFARLQFAAVMLMMLVVLAALRPRLGAIGFGALALALAGLGYHVYRVHPYAGFLPEQALAAPGCAADSRLSVMVANVQRDNEIAEPFMQLALQVRPDVLVVLETDRWWDAHLARLRGGFPHVVQAIPEQDTYYGMHVFSRHPPVSPEFRYLFGRDTPMLDAGLRMPDGRVLRFYAMHPRPPQAWSQPTTSRDGHLMQVALEARIDTGPVIVAGDLNAVPWERTVRRAMRIAGLLDPRVGRGFIPTYEVGSLAKSWPLDQILFTRHFGLLDFRRLPPFGSDHYAILAELCLSERAAAQQQPAEIADGDLEEAEAAVEAARRLGR